MTRTTCHAAREVAPGFLLGGIANLPELIALGCDVLVPLDRAPGSLWDSGWRGELLYCPVTDYGVLPEDVLEQLVEEVLSRLRMGRRVGMFCLGGHGRTGYAAACVLFRLGRDDPIGLLARKYCGKVIETDAQANAVVRYMNKWRDQRGL